MKLIKYIRVNIFSILLVFTVFGAVFSIKIIPFFTISLLLLWFFRYKNFDNLKLKLNLIQPFYIYCFIVLIAFFFSQDLEFSIKILERYTSFIIFPLIIFCKNWSKNDVAFFQKFFNIMLLTVVLYSVFHLIFFYATHIEFVATMDDTYLQWKLPHLSGFHPTYFGFLIVVSNIFLLNNILDKNPFKNINFYLALFLSLYLLYLSPRTSVICLLLVWLNFLDIKIRNKKINKRYYFVFLILALLLIISAFFSSKYLIDKFIKSLTDRRFLLWLEALKIIKENYFLLGEGLGESIILLQEYINDNELKQFIVPDLHNQYLMNYVDMGISGLFGLLYMIFKPVLTLKKRTLSIFALVFLLSIFTESFLFVIKGIIIFIILFSFLIVRSQKDSSENNIQVKT